MARAGATPTPPTTNRTRRPSARAGVQVPYGPSTATRVPAGSRSRCVAGVAPFLDREAQPAGGGRRRERVRVRLPPEAGPQARGGGRTAPAERRPAEGRPTRCSVGGVAADAARSPAPARVGARSRSVVSPPAPHQRGDDRDVEADPEPAGEAVVGEVAAEGELVGEGEGQAGVGQQVHEVPGLVGQAPPERAERA